MTHQAHSMLTFWPSDGNYLFLKFHLLMTQPVLRLQLTGQRHRGRSQEVRVHPQLKVLPRISGAEPRNPSVLLLHWYRGQAHVSGTLP